MKLPTALGILLLVASAYCWYWLYSRGAYGAAPLEIPIQLKAGASVTTRFSVRERGDHEIIIQYPMKVHSWLSRDVTEFSGKARLTSGTSVVEANLPVHHLISYDDKHGMILFTIPTKPLKEYVLSLQIDRIPPTLAQSDSQASVRVALDNNYYLIFGPIETFALVLLALALLCIFPAIRRQAWRLRRRFLMMVVASTGVIVLGCVGLVLPLSGLLRTWSQWIMGISFTLVRIGPTVVLVSIATWFVASLVAYLRSQGQRGPGKGA